VSQERAALASEPASFFRSRWVGRPPQAAELEPTALPAGFRAAGVAAGLKADPYPESGSLDLGVLVSDETETASAARFSTNALLGAPVIVSKQAALGRLRTIVANSGGSNVGDGDRGLTTARATQAAAAELLGVEPVQVGLASTGVIGRELPREKMAAGVAAAARELLPDSGGFSEAILTTDRAPKRVCLEVALPSGTVRLAVQGKGAGMISPRYATMLCFVETDAALDAQTLDLLTGVTVERSFDRISVDGQLSTSDTVFCLASGASGVRVAPETDDERSLGETMDAVLRQLALEIVADGEGAARVARIRVRGDARAVEPVARAIAGSPLVKCALHGADPNFGRLLQAAGQALAGLDGLTVTETPALPVDLEIEGRGVVADGSAVDLGPADREALAQAVAGPEVEYALTLPGTGGETEVFFSDLSHGYVQLNAEYTT
jgi:glutamate N-acetyltransferase/amino-acid N-acetyltransferase